MIARRASRFTRLVCAIAPSRLVAVEAARVEYDTTTFVVIYFCFRFRRM